MKYFTILICLLISVSVSAQCNNCGPINSNGNFELQNNILGTENANGIAAGEINNWYNTHGTTDYFDSNWNWYGLEGLDSNCAHLCYGNRPSHDHSEGMYTEVNVLADEDLTYCVQLDYGSHCASDNYGKAHVYLTNSVTQGGANGFLFPTEQTHGQWFSDSKKVDVISLDEESDFSTMGMTTHSTTITPDISYKQLWIFTEYLHTSGGFVDCGLLIDNVKLTCQTDALKELSIKNLSGDKYEILPILTKQLTGVEHEWKLDGEIISNEASDIIELMDGNYELCLDIKDDRGACAQLCQKVKIGEGSSVNQSCDYSVCLDAGSGIPVISSISLAMPTGEEVILNNRTVGFGFPYCVASSVYCESGEYEIDYLIMDVNNWLIKNNLKGYLQKGGDNTYDDGCRGNMLIWKGTNVQFLSVNVEDTRNGETIDIYTDQSNCIQEEVEKRVLADIDVFPNPTIDIAKIQFDSEVNNASVQLLDASGTMITDISVKDTSTVQIDMTNQGTGIYYVQVLSDNRSYTERIVKL